MIRVAVIGIALVHAKGRHLVRHMVQHHSQRTMLQACFYHMAVLKNLLHYFRRSGGTDVPILGLAAQQRVPDTAAHHIGLMPCLIQFLQYISRICGDRQHEIPPSHRLSHRRFLAAAQRDESQRLL